VLLGYNETMPVTSRIDIHECERVVVLQQFGAWHLPDNNLAENAARRFVPDSALEAFARHFLCNKGLTLR